MGVYLSRWEKLKQNFETTTNQKRPNETVKKLLIGTVSKASGLTPILKDVDAALDKKQRAPLEQALNKLMVARSTYCSFLIKEQAQYNPMTDDTNEAIWTAYRDLIMGAETIERDASVDAKKLQEAKSPGKEGITWLSLEGDLKGTIVAAKKALGPYAALEKKNTVLKKADAAVTAAEAYTKAAARTQAKEARVALEVFQSASKKCYEELAKVIKAETDPGFLKAVQSFHDAMRALSIAARVESQIKNLKVMEASA